MGKKSGAGAGAGKKFAGSLALVSYIFPAKNTLKLALFFFYEPIRFYILKKFLFLLYFKKIPLLMKISFFFLKRQLSFITNPYNKLKFQEQENDLMFLLQG